MRACPPLLEKRHAQYAYSKWCHWTASAMEKRTSYFVLGNPNTQELNHQCRAGKGARISPGRVLAGFDCIGPFADVCFHGWTMPASGRRPFCTFWLAVVAGLALFFGDG